MDGCNSSIPSLLRYDWNWGDFSSSVACELDIVELAFLGLCALTVIRVLVYVQERFFYVIISLIVSYILKNWFVNYGRGFAPLNRFWSNFR